MLQRRRLWGSLAWVLAGGGRGAAPPAAEGLAALRPPGSKGGSGPWGTAAGATRAYSPLSRATGEVPLQLSAEGRLFNKLLVANRGEIAIRIMKTAKRLGIPTVAIYSDADKTALHARFADEAIRVSYLDIDAIVAAIKHTGADAVHPGYGFLSENAAFAAAVEHAGAAFVGPPAAAVQAMGDKVESKKFAHAAKVNCIPGWAGVVEGVGHALSVAREIGFPVMVKASAGGGGKGMRVAWTEKELGEVFDLATQEAANAFGDSRMLIEKFIEHPRHVEIQLLGDKHGNVIFFPERECSIQRRNQKVIEEAPCPFITPEMRVAMGEQAVQLARAVGYYSSGTCEFLVDRHRNFYFLEMNTRLQVEHAITEEITGVDLVEHMLRVAAGEPLRISQTAALAYRGWAMECRIYAEDPARGFLPSTGILKRYQEPRGAGVRVDSGVAEGSEISMYYDPMISKLVTHGADRAQALRRMAGALDTYVIRGVQHNAPLLRTVLDAPDFVAGNVSTEFLAKHYPTPEASAPHALPLTPQQEDDVAALAAVMHVERELRLRQEQGGLKGEEQLVLKASAAEEPFSVTLRPAPLDMVAPRPGGLPAYEVTLPGRILYVEPTCALGGMLLEAEIGGVGVSCQVVHWSPRRYTLQYCGAHRTITIDSPAAAALAQYMPPPQVEDFTKVLRSPMPGNLVSLAVGPGDEVGEGDELAVVEAMKMRNVLRAAGPGRVRELEARQGEVLAADQVILRFE